MEAAFPGNGIKPRKSGLKVSFKKLAYRDLGEACGLEGCFGGSRKGDDAGHPMHCVRTPPGGEAC